MRLSLSREQVEEFCRRWAIRELAVFGSALRDELGPASDVDVLVTFAPDAAWSLLDCVQMQNELGQLIGRRVDLVSRRAIEASANPIRRREILDTAETVYAA